MSKATRPSLTMPRAAIWNDREIPLEYQALREDRLRTVSKRIRADPEFASCGARLDKSQIGPGTLYAKVKTYQREHPKAKFKEIWKIIENPYKHYESLWHFINRIDQKLEA